MKQEVQVVITLEVDTTKSKEDIKRYFHKMEMEHTRVCNTINRMEFSEILKIEVKEESEIYKTEINNHN